MKIHYRNPVADHLATRWEAFQEQATKLGPYLQRFGFYMDRINYFKIPDSESWKFSAFFKNSKRVIHLSFITTLYQEGAVSFFIYPISDKKNVKGINLYKYLRKHFHMVNRKHLFLGRNTGSFSNRLQKVITSYARFSQFYMQSILEGIRWDD